MIARLSRLVIVAVVTFSLLLPSMAFAGETSNDELLLKLSSDKSSYEVGDIATFSLQITNKSNVDLLQSQYDFELPSGMQAQNLLQLSNEIGMIAEGETKTYEIQALVISDSTIENAGDNNGDLGNIGSDHSVLADTGDGSPLLVIVLIAGVGFAIALVASMKSHKRLLSSLLVIGLAGSIGLTATQIAYADEQKNSLEVEHSVDINGGPSTVSATVLYVSNSGDSTDETETPEGIVYQDGVHVFSNDEWSTLSSDGLSATLLSDDAQNVDVGEIVALEASELNPEGASMIVEDVSRSDDGVVITGSPVEYEQVIKSINVSGSVNAESSQFTPADDITVLKDTARNYARIGIDENNAVSLGKLDLEVADGCVVSLDPVINYDIDINGFDIRTLDVSASCQAAFDLEYSGETELLDKRIGSVRIPTEVGITIGADLYVTASASGEVSVHAEIAPEVGAAYEEGNFNPYSDAGDLFYDGEFSAQVKAGVRPVIVIGVVGFDIVDFGSEVGGVIQGDLIVRNPELTCANLAAWMYADIVIGESEDSLCNVLGLTDRFSVINESNSPKWDKHVENGQEVPECTYTEDQPFDPSDDDYQPELEDNGYGEEPILDNLTGASSYYNKLVEPFNVYAGHSVSIGDGSNFSSLAIGYSCDPGTIFKLTKLNSAGEVVSEEINAFVGYGRPWHGDYIWKIEVLCGRVTVNEITAWSPPPVSLGICETVPYPLHISKTNLAMSVGETTQLISTNDLAEILGEDPGYMPGWSTSDSSIVEVDSEGNITAISPGAATISVEYGNAGGVGFERTCEVVVS